MVDKKKHKLKIKDTIIININVAFGSVIPHKQLAIYLQNSSSYLFKKSISYTSVLVRKETIFLRNRM